MSDVVWRYDANPIIPRDAIPTSNSIFNSAVVDAGFLEWVRLGVMAADKRVITELLAVVDANLKRETANGMSWLRFNGDGYGDRENGEPWTAETDGKGHVWSLLTAERGEYELARGERAAALKKYFAPLCRVLATWARWWNG